MRTFVERPKITQHTTSAKSTIPARAHFGQSREVNSILHLQRTIGNQALQRIFQTHTEGLNAGLPGPTSSRFRSAFSRSSTHPQTEGVLQTKLNVNRPGDQCEQEADRVSQQVMRMESLDIRHTGPLAIQKIDTGLPEKFAAKHLQRICTDCEEEKLHRKVAPTGASRGQEQRQGETKVNAVIGGQPLTNEQRTFFEPRFGVDFSQVRIHTDSSADTAARAVDALAFTRGSDIVFRADHYRPHSFAGRQLLAHELTHVVQQGHAPSTQRASANGYGEHHVQRSELHMGKTNHMLQRLPGDGMTPPGDCSWADYLVLRGSVETAKAVVSMLGACSPGDSCLLLATKIAAITAEIAARVALDTVCFRGGDTGHREQVQAKVNMMNRCYQFFSRSNCSPELIAAMAVVVERARQVIAAAAVVVALALVVALVLAVIALAELIAALIAAVVAAAAELAAATAAAAAILALLIVVRDHLSPEDPSSA